MRQDHLLHGLSDIDTRCFVGDVVGLNILGNRILVLNSQKAISDLLDKRGHIYSDRPVFVGAGELMGLNRVGYVFAGSPSDC